MSAKIIVFEGPDKVGKSSQIQLLVRSLRDSYPDKKVIVYEPTKYFSFFRKHIYGMLASGSATKYPSLFQVIQSLNRLVFQVFVLTHALRKYDIIIVDRWSFSGYVYELATTRSTRVYDLFKSLIWTPDVTFVLHGTQYHRDGSDSYEKNDTLQRTAQQLYFAFSLLKKDQYTLIDNSGFPENVHERIMTALKNFSIIN